LRSFSLVALWLLNFLPKNISAKAAHKMLMKLTSGVNFTNILQANFLKFFWIKNIGAKAAHKMLVKLTSGNKCRFWSPIHIPPRLHAIVCSRCSWPKESKKEFEWKTKYFTG